MSDLYESYLAGATKLLSAIEALDEETSLTVLALHGRLAEIVLDIRRHGTGNDSRVQLARVLTELNRMCLKYIGVSFFELSGTTTVAETPRFEVAQNLPQRWYGHLVGREKELAHVLQLLSPASRHFLVIIDGIGGIGKSALALECAHHFCNNADDLADIERFQAIVWVSAKQSTLTGDGEVRREPVLRTLDDIYAAAAATLRREDITRARLAKQHEIVRSALARQRVLLIIDNLETVAEDDADAIVSFLRELPPPTKAIVTTRHRIDIAYPVRLQGMSWDDGQTFLTQESERKGVELSAHEAKTLFERTGGVPLAMEWSVAQISFGNSVDSVLGQLSTASGDIARYCFDTSMNAIRGTNAQKLLAALALFPAEADRHVLGHVAGINDSMSRDEGLVQLEKLSLVNRQGGKFTMLPLTRSYSLSDLEHDPEFARQTRERWVGHLTSLTPIQADRYWIQDQITILREGDNFISLSQWSLSREDYEILLKVIRPAVLSLQYSGRRTEALKLALSGAESSAQEGDRSTSAWLHVDAGWILSQQGVHEEAIEQTSKGLIRYKDLEDEVGACFAICFLAQAQRHAGQLSDADSSLGAAIAEASRLGYLEGIALARFEMGKLARDQADWDAAYHHFGIASAALSNLGEAFTDITSLAIQGNLGESALRLGKYAEAKEITFKVLEVLEKWRFLGLASNFTARMHLQLALIEQALGFSDVALKYSEMALKLSHATRDERGISRAEQFIMRLQDRSR